MAEHSHAPGNGLRKSLGAGDGIAVSLSSMAPTFTLGIALGALAGIVGLAMPSMWVIAMLPMIGIAVGFARLNARDADCGTAYSWAGRYLSPWVGFAAGWLVLGGFIVFMAYATQAMGMFTLDTLRGFGLVSAETVVAPIPGAVIGIVWLVVLAGLATRGVELAAKMQKLIIGIDLLAVVGICGWALIVGGGEEFTWNWLNPFAIGSAAALANGLVATVYLYWGWDNALRLGEENKKASRAGLATIVALLVVVAVFVLCQIGFQRATTQEELIEHGANGLVYVSERLAGQPGVIVAAVSLVLSIAAIMQATIIACTRQTLAMGRDNILGASFARVSPNRGTPVYGTVVVAAIVCLLVVASLFLGNLNQIVSGAVAALGLLATTYYTLCAISVAGAFWGRTRSLRERVETIIAPLASAAVLAAITLYSGFEKWRSSEGMALDAANGQFQVVVALAVAALGVPVAVYARARKSPYFVRPTEELTLSDAPS